MLATLMVALLTTAEQPAPLAKAALAESAIGRKIANFQLSDYRGKTVSLADLADKKVVVLGFIGAECPLAKLYAPKIEALAKEFADKGVAVLAIDSNSQDTMAEIGAFARQHELTVPVLRDPSNKIADLVGATRTPEFFVLDQDRVVRYRGRFDDQYGLGSSSGYAKFKVRHAYLIDSVKAILASQPIETASTEAVGCLIGKVPTKKPTGSVTYAKEISRIIQKRCVECHRPGEIAPFSLLSYEDVSGWGSMIREVVKEERMPPWFANPEHGKFANDARLSAEERRLINDWLDNGSPEGNPADLPPPRKFVEGWRIGKPDQIVEMAKRPYKVQAEGTINYQYFIADPGFKEDKWIKLAEARPGNRAVVHHIIVFVLPPGQGGGLLGGIGGGLGGRFGGGAAGGAGPRRDGDADGVERLRRAEDGQAEGGRDGGPRGGGMIATYAPGSAANISPTDAAVFVKAGSKLVFQMHYTSIGSVQEDLSYVGFVFTDASKVKKQVLGGAVAARRNLRIPPHADNHKVEASRQLSRDIDLISFAPHMHLRGKAFRYEVEYPDGKKEILLDVPRYDSNWQITYELAEPKRLPAGAVIHCTAYFDNSEGNLANPDPTKEVKWGPQTWDEMMIGFYKALPTKESAQDADGGEKPQASR